MRIGLESGLTLIELMIVISVLAVLAMVAIPAYDDFITRGRRSDAVVALTEMANLQEKFFADQLRYTGTIASLPYSPSSPEGFYALSIPVVTTTPGYTVRATAGALQASKDPDCATLELTSTGIKTPDTPEDCWRR